ncbi:MAG: type IV pilin, partial [archaeon]
MDLKAFLFDESRGGSPVIGVILMVAITVILAAVIATFVMNIGPETNSPANADWSGEFNIVSGDNHDNFTLTHEGGGAAPASEYVLSVSGLTDNS